jgi:hypothetical protein
MGDFPPPRMRRTELRIKQRDRNARDRGKIGIKARRKTRPALSVMGVPPIRPSSPNTDPGWRRAYVS